MEGLNYDTSRNHMEDVQAFGSLLRKIGFNITKGPLKSARGRAMQIGVTANVLTSWEDGTSIPQEEKLPIIAETYGIDLKELINIYTISKLAKEKITENRRSVSKKLEPSESLKFSIDRKILEKNTQSVDGSDLSYRKGFKIDTDFKSKK